MIFLRYRRDQHVFQTYEIQIQQGSNGGKMGENHLSDVLVCSCMFNHIMLWYFWGLNYSKMAN